MEGFGVLRAANLAGVPAVEVRVISNAIRDADRSRWRLSDALTNLCEAVPDSCPRCSRLPGLTSNADATVSCWRPLEVGSPDVHRGFSRGDDTQQPLHHQCDLLRSGPAPRLGCDQLVAYVCRWDRLKDPVGVMRGFAEHTLPRGQAYLSLAGPSVHAVSDDPSSERPTLGREAR